MGNVIGKIISEFNEFLENRDGRKLVSEVSDMIQIDGSQIGDLFRWLEDRRVELSTVDREDYMYALREFQIYALKEAASGNNGWYWYHLRDIKRWAMQQYLQATEDLDVQLAMDNQYDTEYEVFNDYREESKILNYLIHYAETMSPKTLFKAKERLFTLRRADKLSYDLYVKAMLLVLEQITSRCNADHKLYSKFTDMDLQMRAIQGDGTGRCDVASMSINIEDAIDMKRAAERIAGLHKVSVQEAFLMLQGNREEVDYDFHIDIAEEEVRDTSDEPLDLLEYVLDNYSEE